MLISQSRVNVVFELIRIFQDPRHFLHMTLDIRCLNDSFYPSIPSCPSCALVHAFFSSFLTLLLNDVVSVQTT
jgi:hypothetical protein